MFAALHHLLKCSSAPLGPIVVFISWADVLGSTITNYNIILGGPVRQSIPVQDSLGNPPLLAPPAQ